jgi:hypothetical protein
VMRWPLVVGAGTNAVPFLLDEPVSPAFSVL